MRCTNIILVLLLLLPYSYAITFKNLTAPDENGYGTNNCIFSFKVLLEDPDDSEISVLQSSTTNPTFNNYILDFQMPHKYVYTLSTNIISRGSGTLDFIAKNAVSQETFSIDYVCELRPTTFDIEFFTPKFEYYGDQVLPYPSIFFKVKNFLLAKAPTIKATINSNDAVSSPTITQLGTNIFQLYVQFNQTSPWNDIFNDVSVQISYSQSGPGTPFDIVLESFLKNYPSQILDISNYRFNIDFKWNLTHSFFNLSTTDFGVFLRNINSYVIVPALVLGNKTSGLYYEPNVYDPIQEFRYLKQIDKIESISNTSPPPLSPSEFIVLIQDGNINLNETTNIISLYLNCNGSIPQTNFRTTQYSYEMNTLIPQDSLFGIVEGNYKNYSKSIDFFIPQNSNTTFTFSQVNIFPYFYYSNATTNYRTTGLIDTIPPIINWYQYFYIGDYLILQLNIVDDLSGFSWFGNSFKPCTYGNIIQGTLLNGVYECIIDPKYGIPDISTFKVCDRVGNCAPFTLFGWNFPDTSKLDVSSISNITFEINSVDVSNQSINTKMFVFTNKTLHGLTPKMLIFPAAGSLLDVHYINAKYNDSKGCYVYPIHVHQNHITGPYLFSLNSIYFINFGSVFGKNAQLFINSKMGDAFAPIITNIEYPNGGDVFIKNDLLYTYIIWRVYIQDTINGFKDGEIIIQSSLDFVKYQFKLKPNSNNYLVSGDKYNGVYEFSIAVNSKCKDQQFRITDAKLFDQYGYVSYFNSSLQLNVQNPFLELLDNIEYFTTINTTCQYGNVENEAPTLVSFDFNPKVIDSTFSGILNDTNSRIVNFTFEVYDQSGIMINSLPKIYLSDNNFYFIDKASTLLFWNDTNAKYQCLFEIPYAFGFQSDIKVSLYGIVDNQSNIKGFSTTQLPVNTIQTLSTINMNISILSTTEFSSIGGVLNIFGKRFDTNDQVLIQDDRFNTISIETPFNSSLSFIMLENIKPLNMNIPFIYITIIRDNSTNIQYSNTFKVLLNDYISPPSSSSSSNSNNDSSSNSDTMNYSSDSYIPTNPPHSCLNDCNNNGECTPKGCICKQSFLGLDCSSEIIIVPPKINDTIPQTNFSIPSINNDQKTIVYYAVISVIGLNELDNNNNIISRYQFNQWIASNNSNSKYKNITNSTGYFYSTSLINTNDQSMTNLSVSIDYFNIQHSTNITFANQLITMNPYSLKYSINITNYQFKSSLNSLQLILSASIESNDNGNDECSSKEVGTTVESESEFVKMQINDYSLYGRFIKRGIIDNRIKLVTNSFLDSEYNSIDTKSKSQSFIGINIPYYTKLAQLDPDFSVLIDNRPASESVNSICSSKSKLSKAQLAGIIIGSVAFVSIVVISIVYYFYKKKQTNKLEKRLSQINKSINK
ncbi:hypothetical protein CYY_008314 [Polysphondylium violaceum]|uniref:EGF-like domain-containing protein n=1 Tax=Polysphondylium violaceum TaxID=133409 RepID=A0A8J4PPG1_9MYCE|nr:hypothetical protein CYY_008314 [Polysphondylium violaceum]